MQKPSAAAVSDLGPTRRVGKAVLALFACVLAFALPAHAQRLQTLETPHYRVAYDKKYKHLAGEILNVAEAVWPTLAKAYESYDRYERIDILIIDEGDDANGFAIYPFSSVAIYPSHMDWVMRNRQIWIRNVVTHELAHIFSLRRAARLSPFDAINLYGSTYNYTDKINYSFQLPWVPLVAPTWYIEGVAQFEAYMNDNDSWDSQRDMVVRDAYLTGTLPGLDFIETFDYDEDWTQAERCYNTGYAFLIYLKDRFGAEKVRKLAFAKPVFNFSWSVRQAFGRDLVDLFEDFKRSLSDRYADFKDIPADSLADPEMVGGYQQNLAFSRDGRYMAWLGNDEDRRYPLNWIWWKPVGGHAVKSGKPADAPAAAPAPAPAPIPEPAPAPSPSPEGGISGGGLAGGVPGIASPLRAPNPALAMMKRARPSPGGFGPRAPAAPRAGRPARAPEARRSDESGSSGLEFNRDGTRLLTARQDEYARFNDLWEYEFRANKPESEKWHRLTWEERAAYPSYHPSKALIAYSRKHDGSSNLALLDSTGRTWQLTRFSAGEQVYNPRFTPKGDSIYFTLGLGDREAIMAINADAPRFNPYLGVKDSALFPDSLSASAGQRLVVVADWRKGALRHIRFAGDTLFFSSNAEDSVYSVYDVYARLPGDSTLYRATRAAGQAMEPVAHGGSLYYQGFRKQQFRIFRQPLALSRTDRFLATGRDTLLAPKPKPVKYDSVFQKGEFTGTKVAADITPFLAVSPVFLSGTRSYTDLVLGLNLAFGESFGGVYQAVTGALTKRTRFDSPLNYRFSYEGIIWDTPIRHTRFDWLPTLYYSVYHDIIGSNDLDVRRYAVDDMPSAAYATIKRRSYSEWSRWAASVASALPYDFTVGASYWQQFLTRDISEQGELRLASDNSLVDGYSVPRTGLLRNASEHKHYETSLGWGFSASKAGTFLPTGGGFYAVAHKYWATYQSYMDDYLILDSSNVARIFRGNEAAPLAVPVLARTDPWSVEAGLGGVYSLGRLLSVFANAEGGMFLNKIPGITVPAHAGGGDTVQVRVPEPYLWPIMYRLGYYRMSGYPYNFYYRGRDIMEGTFYAFGQAGVQIPLKAGAFLPSLPITSFKQFMLTGLAECGTTMFTPPSAVGDSIWERQYYLLLDVGARLSANFRLYHQFPFTVYAQAFLPINGLKAANLYGSDYGNSLEGTVGANGVFDHAADTRARKEYIDIVKQPRYYVGFNLGLF